MVGVGSVTHSASPQAQAVVCLAGGFALPQGWLGSGLFVDAVLAFSLQLFPGMLRLTLPFAHVQG